MATVVIALLDFAFHHVFCLVVLRRHSRHSRGMVYNAELFQTLNRHRVDNACLE